MYSVQAHIVERIVGVPIKTERNLAVRYPRGDDVGQVRGLFVMDGDPVVHRRVGGDDHWYADVTDHEAGVNPYYQHGH